MPSFPWKTRIAMPYDRCWKTAQKRMVPIGIARAPENSFLPLLKIARSVNWDRSGRINPIER